MTPGIVIKVLKTCAEMIGEAVLSACAGLLDPNDRAALVVRANLSASDESWNGIAGRRTHATAGSRSGIPVKSVSGVQSEIEAAPVIGSRCGSGRKVIIVEIFSPLIVSGIAAIADTRVCALLETDEVTATQAVLRREYSDPGAASDLIDRMN